MSRWDDSRRLRAWTVPLLLVIGFSACSSDDPDNAGPVLPSGIVLYQSAPNFSAIEQSSTSDLNDSEVWGDGTWTTARISPNGQLVLAFGPDDRAMLLTTDGQVITELDSRIYCPSFVSDGEIISLTRAEAGGDENATLFRWPIIGTGNETSIADPVVLGEYANFAECPVVVGALIAYTDDLGVVIVDGDKTQRLPVGEGCVTITFPAPPDEETLPFVVKCEAAEESGLFTYEVSTREITQLISGFVAAPSYSPDGRLLFFGRVREKCCQPVDVWIANADGSNQHLLIENASWPAFIRTPGA